MSARKVTRENYQLIKRFAESHTQEETMQRFGISPATVSSIKKEPTFDAYVALLTKYAQNNYRKRHNAQAKNLRADGPFGKFAEPVHKAPELSSPFADLVNKSFGVNSEEPAKKKRAYKKHRSDYVRKLDNEMFAKALELAPNGLSRKEIAEKIGLSYSQFAQRIRRSKVQYDRFEEEFAKGEKIRSQKRRAWLVAGLEKKGCSSAPKFTKNVCETSDGDKYEYKVEKPAEVKTVKVCEPTCEEKRFTKVSEDAELIYAKGLVFLEKAVGLSTLIATLAVSAAIVAQTFIK